MPMEEPSKFWSAIVKPSELFPVDHPVDCVLTMTNACVEEQPSGPVRLILHVETLASPGDAATTKKTRSLIASFIPDKVEHVRIDVAINDRSRASLEVQGSVSVHVLGIVIPLELSDHEEEEETET
jgi:hypothetical protein